MIKTTFEAYKARLPEFMVILKPLIVVEFILLMLSVLVEKFTNESNYTFVFISAVIIIILSFLQLLIYSPAAFRTIQKRELGEAITIEQAISFQKDNKWRFFTVFLWIQLYRAMYLVLSLIPMAAVGAIAYVMPASLGRAGSLALFLLGAIALYAGILIAYRTYPRIFLAMNIYLTKDTTGSESVNESITLGNTYQKEIWGYILGLVFINLIGIALVIIPLLPLIIPEFQQYMANPNVETVRSLSNQAIAGLWQTVVGLFFIAPMTFLYMSKAYAKIRAISKPIVSSIPQATNPQ